MPGRDRPVIAWFAGASWDEVRGTDRRLVDELSATCTVYWCDPPRAAWHYPRGELARSWDVVAPGVVRIRVRALPLNSRPLVREVTAWQSRRAVLGVLRAHGVHADVQVVASPRHGFAPALGGTRLFYQTDDWLEGAGLMNLSAEWIARTMRRNCRRADAVAAVSDVLVREMVRGHPVAPTALRFVLANGCDAPAPGPPADDRDPVAGLVGQLNERLDLEMLEALVEAGLPLRIVGPRADRDRDFGRRLGRLLSAPSVEYVGPVPAEEVPGHLARLGAGLTPYTTTRFNLASFPLKTLEYLAAGLAVVSTDLPAVRWLDTPHISACDDPGAFVTATRKALDDRHDVLSETHRRALAGEHTWSERARQLLQATGVGPTGG